MSKSEDTKVLILEAAKMEFMEKGYIDASLRSIARRINLTTGAIYTHFKDKNELFGALVDKVYSGMLKQFDLFEDDFFNRVNGKITKESMELDRDYALYFINFVYDNFAETKLLICKAKGSKYENFANELIEKESRSSKRFLKLINLDNEVNNNFSHIISTAQFKAYFELVEHDIDREEAINQTNRISKFFSEGWKTIVG